MKQIVCIVLIRLGLTVNAHNFLNETLVKSISKEKRKSCFITRFKFLFKLD